MTWIEINDKPDGERLTVVVTFAVTWIEIYESRRRLNHWIVVTFAVTWIEIILLQKKKEMR